MGQEPGVLLKPIGEVRTPYTDWAPRQPVERDAGEGRFRLVLLPEYVEGLRDLERFTHVYVLSCMDRASGPAPLIVAPPWAGGRTVGVFASRSPARPNSIGLSVVRLIRVEGNEVFVSPIDLFDHTPLLDIKPYFKDLDAKPDANHGWAEDLKGREHVMLHLRGVPHAGHHEHGRGQEQEHGHEPARAHTHEHDHGHDTEP